MRYIVREQIDSIIPNNNNSKIGILIQVNLHGEFEEFYDFIEEGEYEKLESISNMNELKDLLKNSKIEAEKVSDKFISLLESFTLNCINILGVDKEEQIEVLIHDNEISKDIFYQAQLNNFPGYGKSMNKEDNYLINHAIAIPLKTFLDQINEPSTTRDRLVRTLLTIDEIEVQVRLPSNKKYITDNHGKSFSSAIDKDIELIQCLAVKNNEYICILQGYDHGEFETGIMSSDWNEGVYICMLNALNNTIWNILI